MFVCFLRVIDALATFLATKKNNLIFSGSSAFESPGHGEGGGFPSLCLAHMLRSYIHCRGPWKEK